MGVKQKILNQIEAEDPYYIRTEETLPDGAIASKKIKKRIPGGLSNNDVKVLKSCKRYAYYMDYFFGMCGLHVGWTAVIGLIPFVGMAINVYFGYRMIERAKQIDGGLNKWQLSRMYSNLSLDAALGFAPIVGDFISAYFKSTARNCAIVEHHLIDVAHKKTGKLPEVPMNHENHELQTNPNSKASYNEKTSVPPSSQAAAHPTPATAV